MNSETIKGILTKFFKVGFHSQQYYEIIITNKRLLFIWMGESYKPWMLRIDPGIDKREGLEKFQIEELIDFNDKSFYIYFDSINGIKLKKPTFIKNGFMEINTKQETYKFFTKERKADFDQYYKTLKDVLKEKVRIY